MSHHMSLGSSLIWPLTNLGVRVVGSREVWFVALHEALAPNGVRVVVMEDAACAIVCHVDLSLHAHVR